MSVFIYVFFLVVNLFFIRVYENNKFSNEVKTLSLFLVLLFVFSFGSLRFDVGNDYANYVERFYGIRDYDVFVTPDYFVFKLLTKMFSFVKNGYVFVIGFYYIFTMSLFFLFFKRKNILFWGFFTLVTFGFYFDILDRIRQLSAMAIFIFAIDDISKNNFKGYLIKVIIATCFHLSAIVMLPFYFVIKKITLPKGVLIIGFLFFMLGFFLGIWKNLLTLIYDNIPYYNEIYRNSKYYGHAEELSTSLGFLGKTLFIFINVLFSPIKKELKTMLFIGLLFYIIGVGNLNIERVSDYFILVVLFSFPKLIKHGFRRRYNKVLITFPAILFIGILFLKEINQEYFKYQTIFSNEYKYQILRKRDYNS